MPNSERTFPQRPDAHPIIYAYNEPRNPDYAGQYKVGFTAQTLDQRMKQHYPTARPGDLPYEAQVIGPAIRPDGTTFMDHAVFDRLAAHSIPRLRSSDGTLTEWVECSIDDIKSAYNEVYTGVSLETVRTKNFPMRQEQNDAVDMTQRYFENLEPGQSPKFLWNAKMRFGKTFAAYQLAKRMGLKRILVMSFKTAVAEAWETDLKEHVDFDGWQFVTRDGDLSYEDCDPTRPIVCFGSFQDVLQLDKKTGAIKTHNEWIHIEDWDLVIFDEYHFGAWREKAQELFARPLEGSDDGFYDPSEKELEDAHDKADENEWELPISSKYFLYSSGTPFRALNSGEFMEDQIFSWTYTDEQRRKAEWPKLHPGEENPYASLPKVVLMTYRVPEAVIKIARKGENNRFSLNEFFLAEVPDGAKVSDAQFVHKEEVQKWLDFIRSKYTAEDGTDLAMGKDKAPFPFSDTTLLDVLSHTFWFLPNVAACWAMYNLMMERKNVFYQGYEIIVCAGDNVGCGVEALVPVREKMGDPTKTKTITLSCGKLTAGVTVKPWSGIFMLLDLNSPETYFQSAFRPQSPWVVDADDENGIIQNTIMKEQVYIFDFAINRALNMVATYAAKLAPHGSNPEKSTSEFIEFLPVLAYDDGVMTELNAEQILDMTVSDTTATMLARRWKSKLLVNVDDITLSKVLADPEVVKIIDKIEAFRTNTADTVKKIITSSEDIKNSKKEAKKQNKKPPKSISDEEKKLRKERQKIQDTLLKFISRIPVFMYLTDNREQCLQDVIRKIEPKLFTNVTGLKLDEFEKLIELDVIDEDRMNETVFLFRRYEDSSLTYTGIDRHAKDRNIGLFSKTVPAEDFDEIEIEPPDDYVDPFDVLGAAATVEETKDDADIVDVDAVVEIDTDKPRELPKIDDEEQDGEEATEPAEEETATRDSEDAAEEPEAKPWTRDKVQALNVGTVLRHKDFGSCKVLGFSKDNDYICMEVNDKPTWYRMPSV